MPLIAGNWKMHNNHLEALALVQKLAFTLSTKDFKAVEVAVLPPFTALRSVQTLVMGDKLEIRYGAQDISAHDDGAYTGEVSGSMLAKLGCGYVLAGHSERRRYHGEDDALVNAKVKAALKWGLVPILCVGETLEVRQAGGHLGHTTTQLDGALAGVPAEKVAGAAIRDRVSAVHGADAAANVRILYGGSVNADNIAVTMAQPAIDGALVGGASLDAGTFARICRYRELAVGA
jgi:triosephosphate isomerase